MSVKLPFPYSSKWTQKHLHFSAFKQQYILCVKIFISALLSHQMEQLFKLDKELRQERVEMYAMRTGVQQLENTLKQQELRGQSQNHSAKAVHVEVKQLEHDIHSLRGLCDNMSKKVTNLTGGKVPLGETSINFENYLSQQSHAVPDTQDASSDMSSGKFSRQSDMSSGKLSRQSDILQSETGHPVFNLPFLLSNKVLAF